MKGSIYKYNTRSGKVGWRLQFDAGRDENGKRIRITKSFALKKDAAKELDRVSREHDDGLIVKAAPRTFGAFLREWLREHAEQVCTPKTAQRYRELARYLEPLENLRLEEVSTLTLERLYNRLRESGGKGGRPLSARTVRHIAGLINVALNGAIRWKLIRFNPAVACALPAMERAEPKALERDKLEWLLDAAKAKGEWLYAFLVLSVATGCRRGELCALAWSDLILESSPPFVSISKSLEQTKQGLRVKTPKGRRARRFPLPARAVEMLKAHRATQETYRRMYGKKYETELDLVFATPEGAFLKPDSVSAKVSLLARSVGLPAGYSLHSLRHSHASQLLAANVPLTVISRRLGHSQPSTTANIYGHAFSGDELAAAEAWDRLMSDKPKGAPN